MNKKKLGVIGTFIRDRIFPLKGDEVQSIGGLYHTLAYASLLGGQDFEVLPVARVGRDFYPKILEKLQPLPGVDLSLLQVDEAKNTQVKLIYKTPTSRDEITTAPMRPIAVHEVQGLRDADAVIINMITGEDIELAALKWLAKNTRAFLHFDFHTLALGMDDQGKRYYRKPVNWQEWIAQVHVLQMNELEAALLGDIADEQDIEAFRDFMRRLLQNGLTGVHVTLGDKGVLSGRKDPGGRVTIKHIVPEIEGLKVKDIIGCGDAFGAAFIVHYLKSRDFFQAAKFATHVAAMNTTFMGSLTIEKFEQKIKPYANLTS